MNEYIVSARKYRPATFDTVVGQRALTTTLLNAIRSGKLAHAYLFCGPRGVGKTTCARIFAKTINCLQPTASGEACQQCDSCLSFDQGRSMNIHELDAASNNSVDDIRELIDQVRIPPQGGRYKVFIIDEVHMLSTAAFNAFLKTLEEPPAYVIFILATTEKHKILPTILSRCQVYDFNRISLQSTVEHLQYVAEKEGVQADPQALHLIARKADGGMRDALSIFDQMASFTQGNITLESTLQNLNMLSSEYYFRLTDHLVQHQVAEAMLLLNEIIGKGFDPGNFVAGFAAHLRNLMVARDAQTLPLLEVAQEEAQQFQAQAARTPLPFVYAALQLCQTCDANYRQSRNKRLMVEITLIQLAQLGQDDTPSSGLRPAQTINPLFNALGEGVESPKEEKPLPVTKPTAVAEPRPAYQQSNSSTTNNRMALSLNAVSINQLQGAQPQQTQAVTNARPQEDTSRPAPELTEELLRKSWNHYFNTLPETERQGANRLRALTPVVVNSTGTFLLRASNQLLLNDLQKLRPAIEAAMRQFSHIPTLSMQLELLPQEMRKPKSRREQLEEMMQHNPALKVLIDNLPME